MMTIRYEETGKADRDFRRLLKKFRSLRQDLDIAKKNTIEVYHLRGMDNGSVFPLSGFGDTDVWKFYKVKKFACRSLKGRGVKSGIRLVYAYSEREHRVVFLEMYHKGSQDDMRRDRVDDFIRSQQFV